MAYVYAFNPAAPANTDLVKDGALEMRTIKNAVIERVQSFFQNIDNDPWQVKAGVTFLGNFTQNAGTAALQAVTATTVVASSSVTSARDIITQGTITSNINAIATTVTWNSGGVSFTHQFFDITDTASAAGSLIAHWRVSGSNKFLVSKTGALTIADTFTVSAGGVTVTAGTTAIQALTATTGTFSGTLTSTKDGLLFARIGASTSIQYFDIQNTTGRLHFGLEGSVAGTLTTGTTAYATVLGSIAATALELGTNNNIRLSISSAGAFDFKSNALSSITTLSMSGALTSTVTSGELMLAGSGGTSALYARYVNTGGNLRWGIESSTGGSAFPGAGTTAYAAVFGSTGNTVVQIVSNSGLVATFSTTAVNMNSGVALQVNGTQVVTSRRTGWTDQTATASRADLGAAPTVGALSSFCRALYDDLKAHGLIGN